MATPYELERQTYLDVLGIEDDPSLSISDLKYMTAGGANVWRSAYPARTDYERYFTDLEISQAIGTEGTLTKNLLDSSYMGKYVFLDEFKRAYRKRIVHSLPFKSPDYDDMAATWGQFYPQAFTIDPISRELFVCSRSRDSSNVTTGVVVTVYDWDTGNYKTTFGVSSTLVSAGATIIREGSMRFLYLRTVVGGLGKYNITNLPIRLSEVSLYQSINIGVGQADYTYANGTFTIPDISAPLGNQGARSRGQFRRVDAVTHETTGNFILDETVVGGNAYAYASSVFPKAQGLADGEGYYVFSYGGFWGASTPVTHYSYQGVRVISPGGTVLVDALMDPSKMIPIITDEIGYTPLRLENEGIQIVDGKTYSITITNTYSGTNSSWPNGHGIIIFEEFSDHPDAIDFTSAGATWASPPITRLESGMMPKVNGSLRNLLTSEELTNLPDIFEYMKAVNQGVFRFHTTLNPVEDALGNALPSGCVATVYNGNSHSFFVELVGASPALLHFFPDDPTGWIQRTILQDTNWTSLSITEPLASGYYSPSYRRIGKEVLLDGAVTLEGHTAATFYNVAKLPVGFRPSKMQYYPATVVGTTTENVGRVRVDTDGNLEVSLLKTNTGVITLTGVRFSV